MALDTAAAAARHQDEVFHSMVPEQRVAMAVQMSEDAFLIVEEGIRMRHADYSERDVWLTGVRLRIGDRLFVAAFPGEAVLPP